MDVQAYLEEKGFSPTRVGDNWNIDCPWCDDNRSRLGIHMETGQWNCFNCDSRGKTLRTFAKKFDNTSVEDLELKPPKDKTPIKVDQSLADKYHKKISKDGRQALTYLQKDRGFSQKSIDHFQLGSWKTNGHEYVSIPFWKHGTLVNIKFRAASKDCERKWKWRRIKGGESVLFHDDVLDDKQWDHVFICEAELDCISLFNAGMKNVIAATTGAKGMRGFKQEWFDRLERFKKVYIVYDNDVDGQAGAEKMANRLGFDRCLNVRLPQGIKDVNQYFWDEQKKVARYGLDDFRKLVKDARKFEVRDTVSLRDAIKDLHKDRFLADEEELYGLTTPWKRVNKIMGGAKPGHLVVTSAPPKIGKTTWVLNWCLHLGMDEIPTYIYECEMKPKRMAEKMVAMHCKDFMSADEITEIQLAEARYGLPTDHIYFGYPQQDQLTLDNVCDRMKEAVQRYGIKMVVFDNLHFLVRGGQGDVKDQIGQVTRRFKLLAETLNIVFVLIVHPRKVNGKLMTADDLKDSSSIYQDLDTLVILHRNAKAKSTDDVEGDDDGGNAMGSYDELTDVHISGRWCEGGRTSLYFEGKRALFHEQGSLYMNAIKKRSDQFNKMKKQKQERRRK